MSLHSLETWLFEMPLRPIACDAPGRDAANPSLLDHRHQRLLGGLAGLEEGWEIRALPQLWDPQLERAEARVETALTIAVAIVEPFGRAFVPAGADQPFDIGFHQDLQGGVPLSRSSARNAAFRA